ncbi:hypothetical protein ACIPVK_12415 [Paeniglutamicibacter sp. MACA_103]|uniref:hypothetical protein n=1 Tax=Paeniglutamicibacter sp. MACA_103 TaxID=3377337 RepID=UPI00389406BA
MDKHGLRWRLGLAAGVLLGIALLVPLAVVVSSTIGHSLARSTVVVLADGTRQKIHWRDYPSTAGIDPQDVLQGPTPEEGLARGQAMVAEIKAALDREFSLEWRTAPESPGRNPFLPSVNNEFGGTSLLTAISGPRAESTTVPEDWNDKMLVIRIIADVSKKYGYAGPEGVGFDPVAEGEPEAGPGPTTPEEQVMINGEVRGPAGQWLAFTLRDFSKDQDGYHAARAIEASGPDAARSCIELRYGADGLLPENHREEYIRRLEPFLGLVPPPPVWR